MVRSFLYASLEKQSVDVLDGTGGADIGAGAAVNAHVRVDLVDVALADSAGGALGLAGATSNTRIFNSVSHDELLVHEFVLMISSGQPGVKGFDGSSPIQTYTL